MPKGKFQVIAPPSAVVKFLTAWNENEEKSAISPAIALVFEFEVFEELPFKPFKPFKPKFKPFEPKFKPFEPISNPN